MSIGAKPFMMKLVCSVNRHHKGENQSKMSDACPYPRWVHQIRKKEYPLLNSKPPNPKLVIALRILTVIETTYLDHAGTTPYPKSLLKDFEKEMNTHLFGNPHSHSPSSMLSTDQIESTRIQTLKFFHADPKHFDLIFVANATAAIKLVMDCVADYSREEGGFWYGYHADAHTSLVGVREVAGRGSRCFASDEEVERWLSDRDTSRHGTSQLSEDGKSVDLFAYPAQSNMNGRRLPLSWPGRIRSSAGPGRRKIYSLLDAAALVATAPLDLGDHQNAPDFTALSFYKIFGFPDLGALIVRKDAGHVLSGRRYFGGGTVDMVINGQVGGLGKGGWYAKKTTSLHEMLEDGTPAFHSIIALKVALGVHTKLFGSMTNVSSHTCDLRKTLYDQLSKLTHANGVPVCQIYQSPDSRYGDSSTQGPTIAFNVRNSQGDWVGKSDFETLAVLNNIQIRTGGLCNPGGIASSLDISPAQMLENFKEGLRCGNEIDEINGKPTGVVRVSLGAMSSANDIATFMDFMQMFVEKTTYTSPEPRGAGYRRDSEEFAIQDKNQPLEYKYDVQFVESPVSFSCPVAACTGAFESRDELWRHFHTHKVGKRRRDLCSRARKQCFG